MAEDLGAKMVFIRAIENAIFLGTILALGALVDEVLADKLLELLQKKHALGIGDR